MLEFTSIVLTTPSPYLAFLPLEFSNNICSLASGQEIPNCW